MDKEKWRVIERIHNQEQGFNLNSVGNSAVHEFSQLGLFTWEGLSHTLEA